LHRLYGSGARAPGALRHAAEDFSGCTKLGSSIGCPVKASVTGSLSEIAVMSASAGDFTDTPARGGADSAVAPSKCRPGDLPRSFSDASSRSLGKVAGSPLLTLRRDLLVR